MGQGEWGQAGIQKLAKVLDGLVKTLRSRGNLYTSTSSWVLLPHP